MQSASRRLAAGWRVPRGSPARTLAIPSGNHETWRDENELDNLPKVRRRDGTLADIDKTRGFVDYYRNPDPYRDPLEVRDTHAAQERAGARAAVLLFVARQRVFDWHELNADGHDEVERTVQAARWGVFGKGAQTGVRRLSECVCVGAQVHGLWHAVLPDAHGLPCQQSHPRVQ